MRPRRATGEAGARAPGCGAFVTAPAILELQRGNGCFAPPNPHQTAPPSPPPHPARCPASSACCALLCTNLETGAPAAPSEAHWRSVAAQLGLSQAQRGQAVGCFEIYLSRRAAGAHARAALLEVRTRRGMRGGFAGRSQAGPASEPSALPAGGLCMRGQQQAQPPSPCDAATSSTLTLRPSLPCNPSCHRPPPGAGRPAARPQRGGVPRGRAPPAPRARGRPVGPRRARLRAARRAAGAAARARLHLRVAVLPVARRPAGGAAGRGRPGAAAPGEGRRGGRGCGGRGAARLGGARGVARLTARLRRHPARARAQKKHLEFLPHDEAAVFDLHRSRPLLHTHTRRATRAGAATAPGPRAAGLLTLSSSSSRGATRPRAGARPPPPAGCRWLGLLPRWRRN
jgi:hypothetical protein